MFRWFVVAISAGLSEWMFWEWNSAQIVQESDKEKRKNKEKSSEVVEAVTERFKLHRTAETGVSGKKYGTRISQRADTKTPRERKTQRERQQQPMKPFIEQSVNQKSQATGFSQMTGVWTLLQAFAGRSTRNGLVLG